MKILMVHNYLRPPSGENTVFEQEVQLLKSKGHKVISYTRLNSEIDNMGPPGKLALPLRAVWSRKDYRGVQNMANDEKPDIAHFHNIFPLLSPSVYRACKDTGMPVVQTLHNFRIVCPGTLHFRNGKICEDCAGMRFLPGIRHGCYRNSSLQTAGMAAVIYFHLMMRTWQDYVDLYITLSDFALNRYVRLGFPSSSFYVKTNFLQAPVNPVSGDEGYGIYIGRISEEKGISSLMEALKRCPEIPFKIIGGGPLTTYLVAIQKKCRLHNVEYLGVRNHDECMKYLLKARFLVLPSRSFEGAPMVILEAMSAGKPVIVSNIGVLPEMIQGGVSGFVFSPGADDELAEKMKRLHANPDQANNMGKKSRTAFEEKYTKEVNYRMIMEAYQQAIRIHNEKIHKNK